jgi:hypothetical protein
LRRFEQLSRVGTDAVHERRGELHVLGVARVQALGVGLAQIAREDAGGGAGVLAYRRTRPVSDPTSCGDRRRREVLLLSRSWIGLSRASYPPARRAYSGSSSAVVVQPQVELELGDQGLVLLVADLVEGQQP